MPPLTLSCFLTFLPPFALPAFLLGFTIAPEPKFTRRSVSRALESSHWCQSPWTRCVTARRRRLIFRSTTFCPQRRRWSDRGSVGCQKFSLISAPSAAQPVQQIWRRSSQANQSHPFASHALGNWSFPRRNRTVEHGGIGELVRFRIPIGPKGRSVLGLIRCCAGHRPFATVTWTARAVID